MRSLLCLAPGAAEYAGATAATSTGGTAIKPPPAPALKLPLGNSASVNTPNAAAPRGTASDAAAAAAEKTAAAANTNLKFFLDHSGTDGTDVTVVTAPDHAQTWIDDRYVGATPLSLKLRPGEHQVFVSGTNSSESVREFQVTAKQAETVDLKLKSGYRGGITIQGAAPSPRSTKK